MRLPRSVLAASGSLGWGDTLEGLVEVHRLGGFITPTLTLQPREGNPMPRTAEASAGFLHANGLPNPGLGRFLSDYLPRLRALGCPIIVSLLGTTDSEWAELAEELSKAPGITALELNLTPLPLLDATQAEASLPSEAEMHRQMLEAIQSVRKATSLPLIAKLPSVGIEIGYAAVTAQNAGANVVAVGQALPGVAVRLSARALRFPGGVGGLSGPCMKPVALYQLWRVRRMSSLPILASGGIMTLEDALEFFLLGADYVGVGVGCAIHPNLAVKLADEIEAYLHSHQLTSVQALRL
ncbi:MAG TPA: hypothetical protein VKV18_08140 [Chthonomonas sp.]|uniref:hypothetical protein n=1 Tax=Chthonomonas sp. TaxID=2282153 RepID=UPI002B4B27E7|nr:hypothetical protein [Chthonomonas sp.]HLI48638.1 hypothetical protein [Chthonomonas sp.]